MEKKVKLKGAIVKKIETTDQGVIIHAKQYKPLETTCPYCGSKTHHLRYTRSRTYKDSPIVYNTDTYLALQRLEGKCRNCNKSFMLPSNLVHDGTRMTINLHQFIMFLLSNPYNLSNEDIAKEATVSENTILKIKQSMS